MKKDVVPLLLSLVTLTSCTIDAYEKGEGSLSLMTADFVEAHVDGDKRVTLVETDQDERLQLSPSVTARWIERADTVYRALLYYNKVEDGQAEPVSLGWVGVLPPRDSIKGGMKTDPVHLESMWLAKNRKYLNLRLRLMTGSADDEDARHAIGMVGSSETATDNHAYLHLYHDQGGMPEYYSSVTFASIPLAGIAADTLTVVVNTYDGVVSRTFVSRP